METFLITEAMTVVETNLLPVVQFEVRSAVHDRHQYLLFLLQEPAVQGGEAQAQAQHMAASEFRDSSIIQILAYRDFHSIADTEQILPLTPVLRLAFSPPTHSKWRAVALPTLGMVKTRPRSVLATLCSVV